MTILRVYQTIKQACGLNIVLTTTSSFYASITKIPKQNSRNMLTLITTQSSVRKFKRETKGSSYLSDNRRRW
jgi:hypothetical protein